MICNCTRNHNNNYTPLWVIISFLGLAGFTALVICKCTWNCCIKKICNDVLDDFVDDYIFCGYKEQIDKICCCCKVICCCNDLIKEDKETEEEEKNNEIRKNQELRLELFNMQNKNSSNASSPTHETRKTFEI